MQSTILSRRDLEFLLYEWLDVSALTARERFQVSIAGGLGPLTGKAFRIGGLVEEASVKRQADGLTVHFVITDRIVPFEQDADLLPVMVGRHADRADLLWAQPEGPRSDRNRLCLLPECGRWVGRQRGRHKPR